MGVELKIIFAYGLGLILLYLLGSLLALPLKLLLKLIKNAVLGGVLLFAFNFIGRWVGLTLALNPFNALVVGFLGLPGLVLLVLVGRLA